MIYLFSFIFPFIGPLFVGRVGFSLLSLILIAISMGWLWPLMSLISLFVVAQAKGDRRHRKMMNRLDRRGR